MSTNVSGDLIKDIAKKLYPFNYSVVGEDSKAALDIFLQFADFTLHEFDSGSELRGWVIPPGWKPLTATVSYKGSLIYDCLKSSPLGCAYLSPSFQGTVSKADLLSHCAWRDDLPGATVYDWTRLYRIGEQAKWGLSIPSEILKKFPDEDLDVHIETLRYTSQMTVLDYKIQGQTNEEIIINAHNCHPFQANDDISGCAVALALFIYRLSKSNNYYTYRLLIAPELFGPMFWLEKLSLSNTTIKSSILLKSVGNDSHIKIQNSFTGDADIDRVAKSAVLSSCYANVCQSFPYRSYYGNDESVFEAPGIEIPTVTLTRYPFSEYHTDFDTPDRLSAKNLMETYEILERMISIIESNKCASYVQPGLFCLSNPKYNLYRKAPEPGISHEGNSRNEKTWNLLMNCLSRELDSGMSVLDISLKYEIDYEPLLDYILEWQAKGLVKLEPSFS